MLILVTLFQSLFREWKSSQPFCISGSLSPSWEPCLRSTYGQWLNLLHTLYNLLATPSFISSSISHSNAILASCSMACICITWHNMAHFYWQVSWIKFGKQSIFCLVIPQPLSWKSSGRISLWELFFNCFFIIPHSKNSECSKMFKSDVKKHEFSFVQKNCQFSGNNTYWDNSGPWYCESSYTCTKLKSDNMTPLHWCISTQVHRICRVTIVEGDTVIKEKKINLM